MSAASNTRKGQWEVLATRPAQIMEAAIRVIAQDGVRGLRIEKLAAEARVSTALIYYHFKDRSGVLRSTLEHVNARAERYSRPVDDPANFREELEQMLLLEIQDVPEVRENSIAWGELRASSVFDEELRELLGRTTRDWNHDAETLISRAQGAGLVRREVVAVDAAARLTALVEGLSVRWLSGSMSADRARELLAGAIRTELGPA